MSPLASKDRCMCVHIYGCTGPTYWTLDPMRRLCRDCFVALFGKEPTS